LEDFNTLASSLAHGVGDVRGCLILSRDGLVLGAHPAEAEGVTTPAWVRFAAIGDPQRGFAQFGTETWCYVRRGPYAGFAVVGPGARPGLVIDHMDQVLLAAEEGRSRHEGLRGTEVAPVATAPQSKPRSQLHPEHFSSEPLLIDAPAPAVAQTANGGEELPPLPSRGSEPSEAQVGDDAEVSEPQLDAFARFLEQEGVSPAPGSPSMPEPALEPSPSPEPELGLEPTDWAIPGPAGDEPEPYQPTEGPKEAGMNDRWSEPADDLEGPAGEPAETEDEDVDVDRFSLAREFGQLLQGDEDTADG
jgi:hypothetical protein